jgi:hypothetical protein
MAATGEALTCARDDPRSDPARSAGCTGHVNQAEKAEIARSMLGEILAHMRGGAAPTITDAALGPCTRHASSRKRAPVLVV